MPNLNGMIIGIVAVAENYAIGRGGKLPWHYSADLRFFKKTTLNNAVVMGYNTWTGIGRPLPGRLNLVLSRTRSIATDSGAVLLRSTGELTALVPYLNCDLFVMGGSKTYGNLAGLIGKWIVTRIPERIDDADTFFQAELLDGFPLVGKKTLGDGLEVEVFERKVS